MPQKPILRAPLVLVIAVLGVATAQPLGAPRPPDIPFRIQMLDGGANETAAVADINRDGRLDIVSGENWYEGPTSTPPRTERAAGAPSWTKHPFRELGFSGNYIDNFSDLPVDVDGDGYVDIASVTWFAKKVSWFRNPGKGQGPWVESPINSGFNIEFAVLADLDNDGKAQEILAQENGTGQAWYEVRDKGWTKHVVSDRSFGHGIGAGDVNGDGRNDILTPRGWLEAPADPRAPGNWTYHAAWESVNGPITPREPAGGATVAPNPSAPPRIAELGFMHVLDVNGDGRNDIVTAAGHDFGVFWFEQGPDEKWTKRLIDNAWSQGHASTLVDLNGDGRVDLVTGKRFMAHNGSDPGEREPLGVYWYEVRPLEASGSPASASAAADQSAATVRQAPAVEWIRHLIDFGGRMGGGMQIPVVDLDGDGDLDVVCAGKSGLFLAENLTIPRPAQGRPGRSRGTKGPRTRASSR
jgi:FG-GAP-like repeat